jgi:hypothetical protein
MLLRPTVLAVAAALALGSPTATAAPEPIHAVEIQNTARAPVAASSDDTAGYAAREKTDAKQVASYQGGDVVVIGISGGALIVILLILLILL